MDGNRDESERCIQIAERKIKDGDYASALKFLRKADKLYPSPVAKDLISEVEVALSDEEPRERGRSKTREPSSPKANGSAGSDEHRGHQDRQQSNGRTSSPSTDYTSDQLVAVKKIKSCKNYYEILAISKDAGEADIKKAYKKLALQFHPDKNHAPGAADAFKMIGNAFAVLSDDTKRKQYDLYGSEEQQIRHRNHSYGRYEYDYTRGFEAEINPEDLFNMFFGSGNIYTTDTQFRRTRYQRHHYNNSNRNVHPEASGYGVLLQMMPVIILISLSLMSSLFVSDPAFSLVRNNKYIIERKTSNLEVPYFVKDTFEKEYKGSIRRVEQAVEEDYINHLRTSCFRERNYKESMIWRARSFRDLSMEEKAKSLKTPSCDRLHRLSQDSVSLW